MRAKARHFWHPDAYCETACKTGGMFAATEDHAAVTCQRCRSTAVWQAARAAYQQWVLEGDRDEAYERAAARYDGVGKDWR